MTSQSSQTAALIAAIEKRRNEWLHEYSLLGVTHSHRRTVLTARLQELAWTLRLIDDSQDE